MAYYVLREMEIRRKHAAQLLEREEWFRVTMTSLGECPPVTGSSGELKQAVSNLISNAADAVDNGGAICIRLSCVENIDGVAVHIEIEDDGPGIATEHLDRLFKPFFTIKADVGNELGLWVTKEIIERHRGTIVVNPRIESGLGGAGFAVRIPCEPVGSGANLN